MPWARFLRLLRHPAPPPGWLEAAADIPEIQKRPMLLRWIAQHMKAPAILRNRLLPTLPWRSLAAIAGDAAAHPQARAHATERLLFRWPGLTQGERRTLALLAPRQLWPLIWKSPDPKILAALLQNPKLAPTVLEALVQPPLTPAQALALQDSIWREVVPVAHQVLVALDRGLEDPESGLVLGMAAPWIRALPEGERLLAASRVTNPALRQTLRRWAGGTGETEL
jgi:hypothetical protein